MSRSKQSQGNDFELDLMRLAVDPLLLSQRMTVGWKADSRPLALEAPELFRVNEARQRLFPASGSVGPSGDSDIRSRSSLHPEVFTPSADDVVSAIAEVPVQIDVTGPKHHGWELVLLGSGLVFLLAVLF